MTRTSVEYAQEQITVYPTCPFNCRYCWDNLPIWQYRVRNPHPLEEAQRLVRAKKQRTIVISFTRDPYPPQELTEHKTQETLRILSKTKHKVMLLSKSVLMEEDFPLFSYWRTEGMDLWIGTTLTSVISIEDEPLASPNPQRIKMLEHAHNLGLNTWASLEPWLRKRTFPTQIIEATKDFVDFYVIGRHNYEYVGNYDKVPDSFYAEQLPEVIETLKSFGKSFLIKKELLKCLETKT